MAQITESLKAGDEVKFRGFGSFSVKDRASKKGRNPTTGEDLQIPACKQAGFKAGKEFKSALN